MFLCGTESLLKETSAVSDSSESETSTDDENATKVPDTLSFLL